MGAEYVSSKAVIYLFKGSHYTLWGHETYLPSKKDTHSGQLEMEILPLPCSLGKDYSLVCSEEGEKVTLFNKRQSYLFFPVHQKLRVRNIIIDCLDSVIRRNLLYSDIF